jgi:hypothetical protein
VEETIFVVADDENDDEIKVRGDMTGALRGTTCVDISFCMTDREQEVGDAIRAR